MDLSHIEGAKGIINGSNNSDAREQVREEKKRCLQSNLRQPSQ
jgi:hypothetical protein